ncbi:MAG: hypothetical protein FRX49_13796, partial [Trebouxia sp. A1-2]
GLDLLELDNLTWASRPEDLSCQSEPAQDLLQFQKNAIVDANFRLEQWRDTVDPRRLLSDILEAVQKLANAQIILELIKQARIPIWMTAAVKEKSHHMTTGNALIALPAVV